MNFGLAYSAMEMGAAVRRLSWDAAVAELRIQRPDKNSKMTIAYTYLTNGNELMPYLPTFDDLAGNDWVYANADDPYNTAGLE